MNSKWEIYVNFDSDWWALDLHSRATLALCTTIGFSQDLSIGCPKMHIWVNWVSNSFSSHCIKYTKIWILGCPNSAVGCLKPRVQTWSRLPGTVWRGLIFFTTDRPHYHRMPPLSGDNHGWVVSAVRTGCALGHRATTIRSCAHLMKTAARYKLRAQGRYFVPEPNMFGGVARRSPGEHPHDVIAGESPA